jgi:hypothetical protein
MDRFRGRNAIICHGRTENIQALCAFATVRMKRAAKASICVPKLAENNIFIIISSLYL